MQCKKVQTTLYKELSLDEGSLDSAVTEHLMHCKTCAQIHTELQNILHTAATLPQMQLSKNLWPAIQTELDKEKSAELSVTSWIMSLNIFSLKKVAFGCALVVAIFIMIQINPLKKTQPHVKNDVAPSMSTDKRKIEFGNSVFASEKLQYEYAIESMNRALEGQSDETEESNDEAGSINGLDQQYDTNLMIIDSSIKELEQVVEKEPENKELSDSLLDMYRKKLELMTSRWQMMEEAKEWGTFFYQLWKL